MKTRGLYLALAAIAGLAACSNSSPVASSTQSQDGSFTLQSQGAGRGGEARVALRAETAAAVTVISEITYDTSALSFASCSATATGKNLNFAEPSAGKVRAVLAGDLEPLAAGSEVLSCSFKVLNTAAGNTNVQVHGEMSDASFTDHSFSAGGTIQIGS